jgi:hypothetical protein
MLPVSALNLILFGKTLGAHAVVKNLFGAFGGLLEHYLPLKGNHRKALEHPAQADLFVDNRSLARKCVIRLCLALVHLALDRQAVGSCLHPRWRDGRC